VDPENVPNSLEWLILTDNRLKAFYKTMCKKLTKLRKLMLAWNKLEDVSLRWCKELELVRLSQNYLEYDTIHDEVKKMPSLSWLAIAGNNDERTDNLKRSVNGIEITDLELHEVLGEGTSGIVHRATWHGREVSVKIFKTPDSDTGIPSDGAPHDEINVAAFLGTGVDTISQVLARVKGDKVGLVMKYINDDYRTLGKPPSIESVSRDTYADSELFSASFIKNVLMLLIEDFFKTYKCQQCMRWVRSVKRRLKNI